MATFTKLPSGKWRTQVRRKRQTLSETFVLRRDAELWARRIEREIDLGQKPMPRKIEGVKTLANLIDLHVSDMKEVGKTMGRSKAFSLDLLKDRLGNIRLPDLDREGLIAFGKKRANEGAGPVTLSIDLGYIRTVMAHGAAVHGLTFSPEPVDLARIALKRLGLVGKGTERDRRPTEAEIDALLQYFCANIRQIIPIDRIVRFAVATAMRQEEICRAQWMDVNTRNKTLLIRDRKDPRKQTRQSPAHSAPIVKRL